MPAEADPAHDWERRLASWNARLLGALDTGHAGTSADPDVTPEILASRWLGAPGATDAQLGALEARLRVTLPPSYRSFLQTSNGFLQPSVLVPRLLPTDEVDWFRSRHQDVIDAWSLGLRMGGGATGDPDAFEHYLPGALQVSAIEHAGSAVYLLNPQVVDAEGEWEAFYFAHWIPGVNRYPSFRALMEDEMKNWEPPDAPAPMTPQRPPSPGGPWWDALLRIFRG